MECTCQFEKGHLLPHVEKQCADILAIYRAMGLDPIVEPKTAVSIIGTGKPFCNYYGRMSMLLDLTEARMNNTANAKDLEVLLRADAVLIEPYLKDGIDLEDWERSWPYLSFPLSEEELDMLKVALALQIEKHLNIFDNGTAEAHPEEIEVSFRKLDRLNHIFEKHFTARSGITKGLTKNGVLVWDRVCEFINEGQLPYVEQYCQDVLSQYRAIGIDPMIEPPTAQSTMHGGEVPFYNYYDRMVDLLGLTGARRYLESPDIYKKKWDPLEKFQAKYQKREAKYLEELLVDIKKIKPYAEQGFDFVNWERHCPYITFPLPEDKVQILKKQLGIQFTNVMRGFTAFFEQNMLGSPESIGVYFRLVDRTNYILERHFLAVRSAAG